MPEEIVYNWPTPRTLFNDLTMPEQERSDIVAHLQHEGPETTTHRFAFHDARGQAIQFPIRLISNTVINHSPNGEEFDMSIGPIHEGQFYSLQIIDDPPENPVEDAE